MNAENQSTARITRLTTTSAPMIATTGATVVSGLVQQDEIIQDEVFGPVITVQRFTDEDEAIAWANGTRYGLQAGIFTTLTLPGTVFASVALTFLKLPVYLSWVASGAAAHP